jgi:hypothetical protein
MGSPASDSTVFESLVRMNEWTCGLSKNHSPAPFPNEQHEHSLGRIRNIKDGKAARVTDVIFAGALEF